MNILNAPEGFLGLPLEDAVCYADAKAAVIPFGLEASVSFGSGTAKGPEAIIAASHEVELFDDESWCEPFRNIGIATLPPPVIDTDQVQALQQLENIVEQTLKDGKFPLVLGGEHSITAGAIRPFSKRYQDLVILHFDAHADLRDGYQGMHYSHASALRRCLDDSKLSLVSVGIRNISAEEIPFYTDNQHRIHIFWARNKSTWQLNEIMQHLKDRPIYLTFDVDCFDVSLMPATGTPEPGGLFWDEAIEIIRAASQVGQIVGADINELAPIEHLHGCNFLCAKLAYKILTYALYPSAQDSMDSQKVNVSTVYTQRT